VLHILLVQVCLPDLQKRCDEIYPWKVHK
jgi:hypothetical protein